MLNVFYSSIEGHTFKNVDGLNDIILADVINKHSFHESIAIITLHMDVQGTICDFKKIKNDNLKNIKYLTTYKLSGCDGIQAVLIKSAVTSLYFNLCMS